MYSRVRCSGLPYETPCQPSTTCGPDGPIPRMKRPPESASSVIAVIAVIAGVRPGICMIAVPSRIFFGQRADPRQRRDRVGAVGLCGPRRVEACALGLEDS